MQRVPIYKRQFWRDFRVDILRAPKDPRARKSLVIRLALLIYFVAVLSYYGVTFYSFHDPSTAVALGIVLVIILAIIVANKYSQRREARKQLVADFASAPAQTRDRVQRLAHGLAAVIERAHGELWLAHNIVPNGHVVVTRRITIDSLQQFGVWDEMPSTAREWMMRPDGAWPADRIIRVLATGELLNSLLWALGLQDSLRPAEELLTPLSMKRLALILKKPAPGIRPSWDIRLERNRAFDYFWRCYAERVHRREIHPQNEEQAAAMQAWMDEISAEPHVDFLLGAATVRELGGQAVQQATVSSGYRGRALALLMNLLDGEDVWEEVTDLVYGCLVVESEAIR
jgi:hypothetical protein